ncbi:MAG: phenylalanine--tRNA ligase subunit beta [Patescibacteria group bacterium]|nr:phenylalanine--tRNA ligase subunit beta [Patescibacteria group bacterium]
MNLLVSYDWLKEYVSLNVKPEDFAARISLSGPSVEKMFPQGEELDKIIVGEVLKIEQHPKADKLKLVNVNVGRLGRTTRDENLSLVCGGTNLYEGQKVAVALVGAKVRWHGQGDLIELQPAEIRGIKSEGMICAASEIGLGEAFPHQESEILDLGKELQGSFQPHLGKGGQGGIVPGTPLANVLGLSGDVVMDIEVTSNRPDAMGMVGLAREASAILKKPMKWKELALKKTSHVARPASHVDGGLSVKIDAKKACSRYIGVRMQGVKVGRSPWWLKRRLLSAGIRPINNLVDITNYVMLETGQPMHVFDTKKLLTPPLKGGRGGFPSIHVRFARANEKIQALDGKTYQLDDKILVIADAERPIAVAGVMGGEETGADEQTTDIVLEAATFDPVIVRKGSRKLNLQSDSQLRFEKGLSQMAPTSAMARAIELVTKLAGGNVVGAPSDVQTEKYKPMTYSVTTDEVTGLIGVEVKKSEMIDVLKRLGFGIKVTGKTIKATVPWWRDHDIEMGRDLVEEIARVIGYAQIPSVVPVGVAPRPTDAILQWEDRLKDATSAVGYTEVFSWSFISEDLLRKAGYDPKNLLHVQNPLSSDWAVMRPSLIPGMLQAVADNQEREKDLRLFECSNVYLRTTYNVPRTTSAQDVGSGTWDGLPDEVPEMMAVIRDADDNEPWRKAKGFVEYLLDTYGITDVHWKRVSQDPSWHPGRSAQAFKNDKPLAIIGEIAPQLTEKFKIKGKVGAALINLREFVEFAKTSKTYTPSLPFPEAKRDLALVVDRNVDYRDLELAITRADERIIKVEWFDTYAGMGIADNKKSVAMHLTIGSREKTLESAEVDGVLENALLACKEKFGATVRG